MTATSSAVRGRNVAVLATGAVWAPLALSGWSLPSVSMPVYVQGPEPGSIS